MDKITPKVTPNLEVKKVEGRIKVLKALPYKDSMIYLRMVDNDLFMYDLVFKGQIYSSYLLMKPKKGCKKLTQDEINQSAALIFAGATTTIDFLRGEELDKKSLGIVNVFENARKVFEGKGVAN